MGGPGVSEGTAIWEGTQECSLQPARLELVARRNDLTQPEALLMSVLGGLGESSKLVKRNGTHLPHKNSKTPGQHL